MSNFITLKEAARVSGYHQDYLSQLIRSGKIVGQRLGKEWLASRSSLASYMAVRQKNPAVKTALRFPWYRRHGFAVVLIVIALIAGFGPTVFKAVRDSEKIFAGKDLNANATANIASVLVGSATTSEAEEIIVTGYMVDESGEVQVSISSKK